MTLLYCFKKTLLFALFTLSLFPLTTTALTKISASNQSFVFVRIILPDIDLAKGAIMKFEMCKDDINTSYFKDVNSYQYNITGLTTVFKVPLTSGINYGKISFNSPFFRKSYNTADAITSHSTLNNSLYTFEKGDSISICITADDVRFSGKGNEKYNCVKRLNDQDHSKVYSLGNPIPADINKDELIQVYFEKEHLFYQQKLNILTEYKSQLSMEIYLLLSADLWGEYNDRLTTVLYSKSVPYRKRSNDWYNIVERAYSDLRKKLDTNKYGKDILVRSYKYCDFLYKRKRLETILKSMPDGEYYNLNYSFKELFDRIEGQYIGRLNDKLILLSFLTELNSRTDINLYFTSAIEEMGENNFRSTMQKLANLTSGSAYPFELSDENGRVHKLNDFRGKVLIMDFWFTGCSGCLTLAEHMKPIIASYKPNSQVVFITVCVDKDKKTWLKSLKEGKYSSRDELNLYTGGSGSDHPLVTHYNVKGFPFLLIISKEGKVLSTAPPRPSKNVAGSSEAFKDLINKNL